MPSAASNMSEKALRYLSQVDTARCDGRWNEVPDLVRKLEKHAPSRKCLVATARAEAQMATYPHQRTATTARFSATIPQDLDQPLLALTQELEAAIAYEKHNEEDKFQAQICLAWLYWNNSDYQNAKTIVPMTVPSSAHGKRVSDWTTVCIVKSAFFRASSEEGLQNLQDVPAVYEACLNSLDSLSAPTLGNVEFCFWWERFFSRCCGCFYGIFQEDIEARRRNIDTRACLQAFRLWSSNWEHLAGTVSNSSSSATQKRDQRLLVWRSYYHVLSEILQQGYHYALPTRVESTQNGILTVAQNKRKLLCLELYKVEAQYEAMLLHQVSFPEASKANTDVDDWVNSLIANWRVICGPNWQESDLGQCGKRGASRRVLESLYKAATLTFHSTSVLRHLFTLHTALAEFGLAEKALDSYLEIITKGKARVKKSGIEHPDLDDDELMLQTIVGGIEMLCDFGKAEHVKKSISLSNRLLRWLEQNEDTAVNGDQPSPSSRKVSKIASNVYASVHRAIAISKASWARLTYESKDRSKLQADAIAHLKIALRSDHLAEEDAFFLYPLALILAETRNIEGAIVVIKQALTTESRILTDLVDQRSQGEDTRNSFTRNHSIIECWHLLSLLLSSRQEFETAEVASRTALEQYEGDSRFSDASDNLKNLSFFRKKQIMEAKMTQISLAEVSEGSQDAVNASAELLEHYSRFFGPARVPPQTQAIEKPPPTATGTIKSSRGSIFGRHWKSVRNSTSSLPQTNPAREELLPPTIAVTADGSSLPQSIPEVPTRAPSHKLQKRRSRHSVRKSRDPSPVRLNGNPILPANNVVTDIQPDTASHLRTASSYSNDRSEVGIAVTHDYPVVQTARAVSLRHNNALQFNVQAGSKPVRSFELPEFSPSFSSSDKIPFYIPALIFSPVEEHRYSIALLNQIWLFISALYRRGNMLEDARQAMDEAFKQTKLAEAATSYPKPSGVRAFDEPGWGGIKSVEEIWADSYAEMGHLCEAEGDPYEAMIEYEVSLSHYPDHSSATVALANILLDIHSRKIPLSRKPPTLAGGLEIQAKFDEPSQPLFPKGSDGHTATVPQANGGNSAVEDDDEEGEDTGLDSARHEASEELDLLASRDRAYTLLSNLTKLGSGWDDSDAWFALGNAYEASGQTEKAKEVLWWVVELEEKRPVRHWRALGQGYKLYR